MTVDVIERYGAEELAVTEKSSGGGENVVPLTVVNARRDHISETLHVMHIHRGLCLTRRYEMLSTTCKMVGGAIGIDCGREGELETASSFVVKTCHL